jgi:hypothetical protein
VRLDAEEIVPTELFIVSSDFVLLALHAAARSMLWGAAQQTTSLAGGIHMILTDNG